ncbi:hypothetical protein RI103_29625 [Paraburkholderia sp. FT54]|uniref:DUF6632 domain-containing protein n=1 Tax=Paraburkholderia sp. FT54 TaxID=3074437 RepID=UPI002877B078|nr:DUF6632 domain-containing protein [Paraburkholderia sp. FT54]WNC92427.1 hypothetical protein RI103_29625 [Paraburkholderia sp. FT54]
MTDTQRLNYLRIALVLVGITSIGLYPLMIVWPDGWVWHTGHSEYPLMIVGMYATLGVFLIFAALNPLAHLSLIWFAVWSSVVHGGIMAGQALMNTPYRGHLRGDVPALLLAALVLGLLTPRGDKARFLRE